MHRFFVPPQAITRTSVTFSQQQAHQLTNVLRLGSGDRVIVLDDTGWQYEVELTVVSTERAAGNIRLKNLVSNEPRTKITLFQGLLRAAKFEVVLQKCTEIGVVAFVPTICERSIIGNISDASTAKVERWQKIIAEAAEQSRRGKLPVLLPAQMFQQAVEEARGLSFIAWEGEEATSLRDYLHQNHLVRTGDERAGAYSRPFSLNVFIGPEGGFSAQEVERARAHGIVPVSLGSRILRAETAAMACAAIALYESGDLGE